MPRPIDTEDDDEDDEEADEESDDEDDEPEDDDIDDDEPGDDEPEEEAPAPARRSRVRARESGPSRGASGMGRPSTGPKVRASAARQVAEPVVTAAQVLEVDPDTEVAPDVSQWPGTSEAAKLVGRHTSTIKLWRSQGRIRALQDASGCWRHHPEDLSENMDTPDGTDPGTVLASGMAAIVVQGGQANERLIEMTRETTSGLKDAAAVLRGELERAYKRINELEEKLNALRDKHAATHSEDLKHERQTLRMTQKHELEVAGSKETSQRLEGLLKILGPVAASIGARLFGDVLKAETIEAAISGGHAAPAPTAAPAAPTCSAGPSGDAASAPSSAIVESQDVSVETKITAAMGRLCEAIRRLDQPQFAGFRAMMPPAVAQALDAVLAAESDNTVGKALAVLVQAAQNLSDLQFMALRPIAPADIGKVLAELREILRSER